MKTKMIPFLALAFAFAQLVRAEEAAAGTESKPAPEVPAAFTKRDKDGDGFLSKDEFVSSAKDPAKAEAGFAARDQDGDGKISAAEFGHAKAKGEGKGEGKKKKKGGA